MRLEQYEQATRKIVQGRKRGGDLVRIVGEIVDHGHAPRRPHHLEPTLDANEALNRLRRALERHANGARGAQRRQRIRHIVPPRHLEPNAQVRAARAEIECDSVWRGREIARHEIGTRIRNAVGDRSAGRKRCGQGCGFVIA